MKKSFFILLVVSMLAFVLRLVYLHEYSQSVLFSTIVGADVEDYMRWARQIIGGQFIYQAVPIHPPAYSYFLALLLTIFKSNFFWLRFTQSFLCFLSFLPLYKIVKEQNNRMFANIFVILAALSPVLVFFQCETYSESLLLIALNLNVFCLYKYEQSEKIKGKMLYAVGIALFSTLAILTHSLSLIFVGIELIYLAVRVRKIKNSIMVTGCLMLIVLFLLPVVIHNSRLAGRFIFTQGNGAFNFYLGNNEDATGLCPLRTGAQWDKFNYQSAKESKEKGQNIDEYFRKKSSSYIADNFTDYLYLSFKKALFVWNWRNFPSGHDLTLIKEYTVFQKIGKYFDIFIIFSALVFLLFKLSDSKFLHKNRHFLFLLLGFYVAQIVTLTAGRYRLGMYCSFLLLSAGFIWKIICWIKDKKLPERRVWFAASIIIGALIVFVPGAETDIDSDDSWAYSTMAEAYMRKKNMERANFYAAKAVQRCENNDRAYMILALCAMQNRSFSLAQELFEKSLKINEYSYQTQVNMALCAARKGDRYLAQGIFLRCVKQWPQNPTVLYNYAYFLLRCGETLLAEKYLGESLIYNSGNAKAYNALGIIYLNSKRYALAVDSFKKALKITPRNFGVRFNMTAALIRCGLLGQAKENCYILKQQQPNNQNVDKLQKVIYALERKKL